MRRVSENLIVLYVINRNHTKRRLRLFSKITPIIENKTTFFNSRLGCGVMRPFTASMMYSFEWERNRETAAHLSLCESTGTSAARGV